MSDEQKTRDEHKTGKDIQEDLEFDIAEELAKLDTQPNPVDDTQQPVEDELSHKDIHVRIPGKVRKISKTQSAFKFGVKPEQGQTRWMRLVVLVAITIAIIVYLFYNDLQRKQEPLKESLKQALHLPPNSAYDFLVSEAMFWNCDPNSIKMEINTAPPQMKESHIYSVSLVCNSQVLWYAFHRLIRATRPIQLPPEAFHHSFFYNQHKQKFVSSDYKLELELDEKGANGIIIKK